MTKAEAAKLVAVLIAAYPKANFGPDPTAAAREPDPKKRPPSTGEIYERMLADLDYPSANAAVERLLATSKWPPTVAEIREASLALTAGEITPGGEAWGLVLRAIGRYGRNRAPGVDFDFGDPVALDVVRALHWRELCDSDNQAADRARFIELYDRLAATARRRQLSEALPAMQRFRALQSGTERALPAPDRAGEAKSMRQLVAGVAS